MRIIKLLKEKLDWGLYILATLLFAWLLEIIFAFFFPELKEIAKILNMISSCALIIILILMYFLGIKKLFNSMK